MEKRKSPEAVSETETKRQRVYNLKEAKVYSSDKKLADEIACPICLSPAFEPCRPKPFQF
jgi:hypothetical protein